MLPRVDHQAHREALAKSITQEGEIARVPLGRRRRQLDLHTCHLSCTPLLDHEIDLRPIAITEVGEIDCGVGPRRLLVNLGDHQRLEERTCDLAVGGNIERGGSNT